MHMGRFGSFAETSVGTRTMSALSRSADILGILYRPHHPRTGERETGAVRRGDRTWRLSSGKADRSIERLRLGRAHRSGWSIATLPRAVFERVDGRNDVRRG